MTRAATAAEAEAFKAHLARRFGARVVRKEDAVEMRMLGAALEAIRGAGVPLPRFEDFLSQYATTIGSLVYLPSGLAPDAEMELVVHELTHVTQWQREHLRYAFLYLAEGEARARYEAEAFAAAMEFGYARTRTLPSLGALAMPLEGGYALDAGDVQLARDLLEGYATTAQAGLVSSEVAREAIAWMRANAPDLLA